MKFFKSLILCVLVFVITGFLGYVLTDKIVLPMFVGAYKNDIVVPNLVGKSRDEAKKMLDSLGLNFVVEDEEYTSKYGADTIFFQEPPAGNLVKKNRSVRVSISKGNKLVLTAPYLIGLDYKEAISRINKYGFTVGKINREYSAEYPKDKVFKSLPMGGEKLLRGAPIDIWVSNGSYIFSLPSFIGKKIEDATVEANNLNLVVGKVEKEISNNGAPGLVLRQYPEPYSTVQAGDTINFVISSIE